MADSPASAINSLPLPSDIRRELEFIGGVISRFTWVTKAVLYGSYATGTYNAESDIDIAVFVDRHSPCGLDEYKQLNREIGKNGYDVQIQIFSEDELDDPCGIVEEVVSFGIDMYPV